MEDERKDGTAQRSGFFTGINGWLSGITGLVVAVSGLLVAWQQIKPAQTAQTALEAPAATEDGSVEAAASDIEPVEAPAEVPFPLSYKAVDATFEKVDGEWVYISATEETHYKEVSRRGGNTVVFDPKRQVYARWPNQGGKVEEKGSDDQAEWEHSFDIWVPKAAQSGD